MSKRVNWLLALLIVVTTMELTAQTTSKAAGAAASIEGDVYLKVLSGDVKPAAGVTVYLLKNAPELQKEMDATCARRDAVFAVWETKAMATTELATQGRLNSPEGEQASLEAKAASDDYGAFMHESVPRLDQMISRATVDQSKAGMKAHYRFDAVAPGEYVLFAMTSLGERLYRWWVRTSVPRNQVTNQDLDNDSADEVVNIDPYCGVLHP